ncbi:hypothetical protein CPB86DRAFT_781851 [Serendipita vermifera]|nr:hypothetical protein CPB86DRAFT_781851 [Serendipita vermifera]
MFHPIHRNIPDDIKGIPWRFGLTNEELYDALDADIGYDLLDGKLFDELDASKNIIASIFEMIDCDDMHSPPISTPSPLSAGLSGTSHAFNSPSPCYHNERYSSSSSFELEFYSDEKSDLGDVSGLLPTVHLSLEGDEYLLSDSPDSNHLFFPNDEKTVEDCYRDFLPASTRPLKLVPVLRAPRPLYPLPSWLFS